MHGEGRLRRRAIQNMQNPNTAWGDAREDVPKTVSDRFQYRIEHSFKQQSVEVYQFLPVYRLLEKANYCIQC